MFVSAVLPARRSAHRATVLVPIRFEDSDEERARAPRPGPPCRRGRATGAHVVDVQPYWAALRVGEARVGLETIVGEGSRYVDLVLGTGRLAQRPASRRQRRGGSTTAWSSAATGSSGRCRAGRNRRHAMSGFAPSSVGAAGLDPNKRVNYQLGLVLGEDEFRQDQFHHPRARPVRDARVARLRHRLRPRRRVRRRRRRLHVRPGLAVDPAGRLICVPVEYCGSLAEWLAGRAEADEVSGGLPPH